MVGRRSAKGLSLTSLRIALGVLVVGVAWLFAGRQFSLFVDPFISTRRAILAVSPLQYDGGGFVIGTVSMTFGLTNNLRSDLELCPDAGNRVVLKTGKESFTLGPRINPVDPKGRPEIDFAAEPGDILSFTTYRSLVGWPTPFEFNFMSRSPWWKRYVYYTLIWKKRSGATLHIRWRYEQDYYTREPSGWTPPMMMWNGQTGLLGVDIRSSATPTGGAGPG